MIGSAVWRTFESKGYSNFIGKTISELDLRNQQVFDEFYSL
jgi:GDP-L-fucose synthase|tara:strand:+ start:292 stop:414 length:123 start_codon:yes stop_codon:yes gene_type:complete